MRSVKHQSLKKLTKREVLEKSFTDLSAARLAEEGARFELARRMQEVGGRGARRAAARVGGGWGVANSSCSWALWQACTSRCRVSCVCS